MLLTEQHNSVLVMVMDRPQQRNAVDQSLTDQLDHALQDLDANSDLLVGILSGGPTFFSAGTDLHQNVSPTTTAGGEYGVVRRARGKPLIAAVEGFALGGGFEIVLACDLVVAGRSAIFGLPEVKRGVVAGSGALFRAWHKLPPTVATEMLLTGDSISAERAYELGLVNSLCPDGQAVIAAERLARRITVNSPSAVATTLAAIRASRSRDEEAGWDATRVAVDQAARSDDRAEGISAFFDRRDPRWNPPVNTQIGNDRP